MLSRGSAIETKGLVLFLQADKWQGSTNYTVLSVSLQKNTSFLTSSWTGATGGWGWDPLPKVVKHEICKVSSRRDDSYGWLLEVNRDHKYTNHRAHDFIQYAPSSHVISGQLMFQVGREQGTFVS